MYIFLAQMHILLGPLLLSSFIPPFFSLINNIKMKLNINTFMGLLLLLTTAVAHGQILDISILPAQPSGIVGEPLTVVVRANKFEGIAGMQFPITYDASKFKFNSINTLPPDLPDFIFNQATGNPPLCPGGSLPPCNSSIGNPSPGKLTVLWFNSIGTGSYLEPNTTLFQIEFTVLATGVSNIFVTPNTAPLIDIIGSNNVPATFIYDIPTPSKEPSKSNALVIKAAPNPFSEKTNLTFNIEKTGEIQLIITDIVGRICYEEKKYLDYGIHGTEIANSELPSSGMYFIHLFSNGQHSVYPIVLQ